MSNIKKIWIEKYRPKNFDEIIGQEKNINILKNLLKNKSLPHLLFHGNSGVGKTSTINAISEYLYGKNKVFMVMRLDASDDRGINSVREEIKGFAEKMTISNKGVKLIILDEADYLTPNAQAALRNLMETFSKSTRFILTCNYPQRIIPALHSRSQGFHIEKLDINEFTARIATICVEEDVQIDLETLDTYVQASYPDLRKSINLVQQNVVDNVLQRPQDGDQAQSDWMLSAIEMFKEGKYKDARTLICSQARPEEYDDIYKFMYRNLDLWGSTELQQDQAIVIIRNGMAKSSLCADPEINLSATLIELQLNSL